MSALRQLLPLGAAWLALLALLGLTLGTAWFDLGPMNLVLNLGIAALKVAIIAVVFMGLRSTDTAMRLAMAIPVLLLLVLMALSFEDFLSRDAAPAAWQGGRGTR